MNSVGQDALSIPTCRRAEKYVPPEARSGRTSESAIREPRTPRSAAGLRASDDSTAYADATFARNTSVKCKLLPIEDPCRTDGAERVRVAVPEDLRQR